MVLLLTILNLPILWSLLNAKDHNFGQFFLDEYACFFSLGKKLEISKSLKQKQRDEEMMYE